MCQPFADELRLANALAALHVMESDRIPLAVNDSLKRADLAIDISGDVRQEIESRELPGITDVEEANLLLRKSGLCWIAVGAVAAVLAWFAFFSDAN